MEKNKRLLEFLESTYRAVPSQMTQPVSDKRVFSMELDAFDRSFQTKFAQYQKYGKSTMPGKYSMAYGKAYQDKGQIPARY